MLNLSMRVEVGELYAEGVREFDERANREYKGERERDLELFSQYPDKLTGTDVFAIMRAGLIKTISIKLVQ
jgi:aldehyde:ferredoxin oxidoreductase